MHAFDVLGDPVRRRILELLAGGEHPAGAVTDVIRAEFGITQPAVSQHLKVLRENGFAQVRAEGTRRLYSVDAGPLRETDVWLQQFRHFWAPRLDALGTEIARGRREGRHRAATGWVDPVGLATDSVATDSVATDGVATGRVATDRIPTDGGATGGVVHRVTIEEGIVGPGT